jgi:hypothetical protein
MTFDTQLVEPSAAPAAVETGSKPLVNPLSGLANDYLNLFNELVMIIEQIPVMPELYENLCAWRPVSYRDYFINSQLPGRHSTLAAYEQLNPAFRKRFETFVSELDVVALASVASVRRQFRDGPPSDAARLKETCDRGGEKMRQILVRASRLVNYANLEA